MASIPNQANGGRNQTKHACLTSRSISPPPSNALQSYKQASRCRQVGASKTACAPGGPAHRSSTPTSSQTGRLCSSHQATNKQTERRGEFACEEIASAPGVRSIHGGGDDPVGEGAADLRQPRQPHRRGTVRMKINLIQEWGIFTN
jgi:hypothetical protein